MVQVRKKILIIEDDEIMRECVEAFFDDLGFEVLTADDGKRGLDMFTLNSPDVVLTDLRMPGIDGLEVVRCLTEENREVPVIVVSGAGHMQDSVEALRSGAWDYVIKPVYDMGVLEHVVGKALEKAELLRANRRYREHLEDEVIRRTEEMKKLSQAVQQSPLSVIICDEGGVIEYVNSRFREQTGYLETDIIGQRLDLLRRGLDPDPKLDDMHSQLRTGKSWHGELLRKKKSGDVYWARVSISPITSRDGEMTHFVSVEDDITDRKELEKQLIASKNIAESANLAKTEFLANISHELRTPMNSILGMSELLLEADINEGHKELLMTLHDSANVLQKIIVDILDLTRIEADQLDVFLSAFDIKEVLGDIIESTEQRYNKSDKVSVVTEFAPEPFPVIQTDMSIFRQIMNNMIDNAFKFTESGLITIRLTCKHKKISHDTLYVEIEDTGIGVPENMQFKIFDRFTQADSSMTRQFGGTGLGLTIAKILVEKLGGKIGIKSIPGNGSKFFFSIPVDVEEQPC